jgi:hypothetical protein
MLDSLQWAAAPPRIAEAIKGIASEPAVRRARENIDKAEEKALLDTAYLAFANYVQYVVYRQYAQLVKARSGKIPDRMEEVVVKRGRDSIVSYQLALDAMNDYGELLRSNSVLELFEQNVAILLSEPSVNPIFHMVKDEFRSMGIPDDLIGAVVAEIEMRKGNPLRILGADGTFDGALRKAKERVSRIQEAQRILEEHGLPVVEGACSSGNEAGNAAAQGGGVIIIGIIACIFLCFL